jgi:hypothetical protein
VGGWVAVAVTFAYAARGQTARPPSPAFQLTSFHDPSRLGMTVTMGVVRPEFGSNADCVCVAVTFAYAAALTSLYDPSRLGLTVTIGRCEA